MVKALVDIDEETNKILNMIKAKHGLKDKGSAIAFIANNFKKSDDEMAELKHLDDGDKWVLAEEIPDMDFNFSSIWCRCFTNEFGRETGRPYSKVLGVYQGYNLKFYFGEEDCKAVAENIVNRCIHEKGYSDNLNEEIVRTSDDLVKEARKWPERNLKDYSNEDLIKIFKSHNKLHNRFYQFAWIPVAADMFTNTYTDALRDYLKSIGVEEDKLNEVFLTLTYPDKKSLIQVEQEDLIELAIEIDNDKYHKSLFKKLHKQFNEQAAAIHGLKTHSKEHEDMLASKMSGLLSQVKPKMMSLITKHYEKYFYVNHLWIGEVSTMEDYIKKLSDLIGTHANVKGMLKELKDEIDSSNAKREAKFKELKINPEWKNHFIQFGRFMVTKIYRRFGQIYALYKIGLLHREIARRFKLELMEVRFLTFEETEQLLKGDFIDREELKERCKLALSYNEKGKNIIYTGVKAKKMLEDIESEEVEDVQEFTGQVACLGKVEGIVKIVIRPSDMEKMNEGDILVSIATDPDILPAMKKAAAFVTEQGGVTSHAAIVARELNTPCVIGTKIATKVLKDGDRVEVDANKGIVRKI